MSDQIFFDGRRFISVSEASSNSGLSRDYIGKLCRDSKIKARRVGKNWYVEDASLRAFLVEQEYAKTLRRESLSQDRTVEYHGAHIASPQLHKVDEAVGDHVGAHAHTSNFLKAASPRRAVSSEAYAKRGVFAGSALHGEFSQKAASMGSTPGITDALRSSLSSSISLPPEMALPTIHIPVHALSPFVEFTHRLVALTLALMMTFGTYALVDEQYARYTLNSIGDSGRKLSSLYDSSSVKGLEISQRSESLLVYAAANPAAIAAAAGNVVSTSIPKAIARLARAINSRLDAAFYAVAFPQELINANFGSGSGARVAVEIQPYAAPRTYVLPAQEERAAVVATDVKIASATIPTQIPSAINQPVIERVITNYVNAAGGLSQEYLDQRLQQLDNKLSSRMYSLSSANSTAITQNYAVTAQTSAIHSLSNTTITNPTITGGTISGVTLSAGALSGTVSIASGGTGISTAPSYGQVLLGTAAGGYSLVATSSLGIVSGVALTDANAWSALQIFSANASSTNFSNFGTAYFGGTATSTFDSTGALTLAAPLATSSGGTGISTYAVGDMLYVNSGGTLARLPVGSSGQVIKVTAGVPAWAADLQGSGGAGAWATSTDNLLLYPATPSNVIVIGASATTTTGKILEVTGNSLFTGTLSAGTTTVNNLVSTNTSTSTFAGGVQTTALNVTGATSTFASGINIATGCFSVNGTCISAGGGSSTWGAITGTLSSQTDLQAALDARLTLTNWYATTTDALAQGSTNKYYSDTLVNTLINASTTIPKTTLANIWTPLQTFTNGFLATASSTIGNGTQAGGLTISGGATTTGSTYLGGTLTASGNAYFAGNVGVGTTSPWQKLSLSGGSLFVTNTTNSSTGVGIATFHSNLGGSEPARVFIDGNGQNNDNVGLGLKVGGVKMWSLNNYRFAGTNDDFGIYNEQASTWALTLDGDTNNVGIGTTTPWKKFSVAGDIIGTNITATGTLAVAGAATFDGSLTAVNATSTNFFSTTASSTNIYSTNGNIGVLSAGTLSIVSTLGVSGLATFTSGFVSQASSTVAGNFTTTGTITTALGTPAGAFLAVNPSGQIIATTTPSGGGSTAWGAITGTLSSQTDLQAALDARLTLTNWYATTTDGLTQGSTNFYFTTNRFATALAGTTTDALTQGSTNKYYSDTLVNTLINASTTIVKAPAAPTYGQVLIGNSSGGYNLVATSTLGLGSGGGSSVWGSFTGTLSDQTDLQSALNAKLSLSSWYATTTDGLTQGSTNKYYSDTLVNTLINASTTIPKTTLANIWTPLQTFTNGFVSQASSTVVGAFTATSFTGAGTGLTGTASSLSIGGNAASATALQNARTINGTSFNGSADITITAASSTLLANSNTWTGLNTFANATTTLISGNTAWFTSVIGALTGNASTATVLQTARTINGTSFNGSADITITAASSTLLANSNTFSGANTFSSLITGSISGNAGTATKLAATKNINGVAFDGSADITITAASSTLLANSNTFSGANTFSSLITGSISGNAGTVTNGVYTTTFNGLFDTQFGTKSTTDLAEGTNQYFTTNRVATVIAGTTTDALAQGSTNKYYSDTLVNTLINASTTIPKTTLANIWTPLQTFTNGFVSQASSTVVGAFTATSFTGAGTGLTGTASSLSIGGNAASATALQTGRTINGTTFDGTANITITAASSTLLANSNTWTGLNTFANATTTLISGNTAWFTSIIGALTGNASTATVLQTARNINGTSFNGSADITITAASSTLLANNNTFSGTNSFTGNTTLANATSTNFFSTTASSTNLFAQTAQFGSLSVLGALTQTGIGTFTNGFVSQASSTVVGAFTASTFAGAGSAITSLTAANIAAGTAGINISGNAATVTTNANLTGAVTSTGNATVLGSFTSSNLLTALTDETGTGAAVFAASPTFTGKVTLAAASSTDLSVSGSFYSSFASALHLSDANNKLVAATTQTCTNQFVRAMSAAYVATCATVSLTADVTGTLGVANGGTGITSFGTGIATWLGTPSSANLIAALTDETGTGAAVFAASPTLTGTVTAAAATFSGSVGIGTTTPFRKFAVANAASLAQASVAYDNTRVTELYTDSAGDFHLNASGGDSQLDDSNLWVCSGGSCPAGTPTGKGNLIVETKLGIGTSTPVNLLHVLGGTSNNSALLNSQSPLVIEGGTDFGNGNVNLQIIANSTKSSSIVFTDESANSGQVQYSHATDAMAFLTSATTKMTITSAGYVGIGTTTPTDMLSVHGLLRVGANSVAPVTMGTATSTFNGDIRILGKLDVSTIDPVYMVDDVKYATYGHSTIGIKEEATAVVQLSKKDASGRYSYVIDFAKAKQGSDFWLFYQVTDMGAKWNNLVVTLTPAFDGKVFYEKHADDKQLVIYSDKPGEVSLRLIASRYDFTKWNNLRPDQDGDTAGVHVVKSKPAK